MADADPDDTIRLGRTPPEEDGALDDDFGPDLGPGEHDQDLMDGSWEERYYAGRVRARDWSSIYLGLALLVVLGLVVPAILVLFR